MSKRKATTGTAITRNKRHSKILLPPSEFDFSIDENDFQVVNEILVTLVHTDEEGFTKENLRQNVDIRVDKESRCVSKLVIAKYLSSDAPRIESLPSSIGQLKRLKELSLDNAQALTYIPEEIGKLVNLEKFKVTGSRIASLPNSILHLKHLKHLDLSNSGCFRSLPKEIGNLFRLETLKLTWSIIESLPGSIYCLKHLRHLDLSHSHSHYFESLPAEIGKLIGLERLTLVDTFLSSLPNEIGDLENLKKLDLSCSEIGILPQSIGRLKNLVFLGLSRISPDRLPETILDLENLHTVSFPHDSYFSSPHRWVGVRARPERFFLTFLKLAQRSRSLVSLGCIDSVLEEGHSLMNIFVKKLYYVLKYNRAVPSIRLAPTKWPYLLSRAAQGFEGDPSFIYELLVDGREALVQHLVSLK